MQISFKEWLCNDEVGISDAFLTEALKSYFISGFSIKPLFEDGSDTAGEVCLNTPLSGYRREIEFIKSFAQSGPDQMAQVLMFSPLTARVSFAAHWDNFPIVMNILKNFFPDKINLEAVLRSPLKNIPLNIRNVKGRTEYDRWPSKPSEILRLIMMSFDAPKAKLSETIGSWKYDTISYIWNNREAIYEKCMSAHASGDDRELLKILGIIPGAGAVKGGFMAQLVFGRIGCIDTHNVDIYKTVFPDLADIINPADWDFDKKIPKRDVLSGKAFPVSAEKNVDNYLNVIKQLADRHIGSQQLWDVWVDFVAKFYKMVSKTGTGPYAEFGPALDPKDPALSAISGQKVTKTIGGRKFEVPVASGDTSGGGASMTHLLVTKEPEEMLRGLNVQDKEKIEPWARSVNLTDLPRAKRYGLTTALTDKGLDTEKMKQVLAHQVARASGAPLDPEIKRELDAIEKMRFRRSRRKRTEDDVATESYADAAFHMGSHADALHDLISELLSNVDIKGFYDVIKENPYVNKTLVGADFIIGFSKMAKLTNKKLPAALAIYEILKGIALGDKSAFTLSSIYRILSEMVSMTKHAAKNPIVGPAIVGAAAFSAGFDDFLEWA